MPPSSQIPLNPDVAVVVEPSRCGCRLEKSKRIAGSPRVPSGVAQEQGWHVLHRGRPGGGGGLVLENSPQPSRRSLLAECVALTQVALLALALQVLVLGLAAQ